MDKDEENTRLVKKIEILKDELNITRTAMQNLQSIVLSNISHDVRTPMNAIVGFANLLATETLDSKDRDECIDQININSIELLDIIDNMIDASLIQFGDMKLYDRECYLNDFLDELYDETKELISSSSKKLNLIVTKGGSNEFFLSVDVKRLRQILLNLISNAISFTNSGQIEFGYTLVDNKVRFFVKDSGIGLGPIKDEELFKPFRPRVLTEQRVKKGAGLGLYVSKGIVDLMEGEMWPESLPGKGTCMYFTIPEKRSSSMSKRLKQLSKITKRNIASFL
jgi:two-component system, chemotaxis family, CheB/CheR fusion protein